MQNLAWMIICLTNMKIGLWLNVLQIFVRVQALTLDIYVNFVQKFLTRTVALFSNP